MWKRWIGFAWTWLLARTLAEAVKENRKAADQLDAVLKEVLGK